MKCKLLVRSVVDVIGQAQHFNSRQYSCVASKLGLQTGGRNVKNILLGSCRRSFTLQCPLENLPSNFLKLLVFEISPADLHIVSSWRGGGGGVCFSLLEDNP